MIAHEYIESRLIDEYGVNYRSLDSFAALQPHNFGAHDIAPTLNNLYASLERLHQPPIPNDNLTNLDEIVDWFVNFYKL
ncbi:hypothetical protein [Chryseobacterium sp. MFBS3-17]|uniref:hypothetical protein n=1 Tax=Chryseobacterium sp. MFBS3-17 TaxID=2886689 RepID=UPI001D0E76A9|nr:hypothetical protein [Chryseobacterium sp. MFBS3-17]MCC2589772.1 hypothetical protein [Chryseobacterium sp. MFBS3-17]